MLSFGMEYERAFSIAFCSARLLVGSPPPSFAATMIARDSFEKSLPRLASAAPFLCLIDDHLLCPDTALLSYQFQKSRMHPCVVGQLRVERRDEEAPLPEQHRLAVELGEHLDLRAEVAHARRADEDAAQGPRPGALVARRPGAAGQAASSLPVAIAGFAVVATKRAAEV